MPTPLEYLIFSNNAYQDGNTHIDLPAGWREVPLDSTLTNRPNGYQGSVFVNDTTHEVVIAHRGTEPEREGSLDLGTDLFMFFAESGQEQAAALLTNTIMKAFKDSEPPYTVTQTGHSLGGFLAGEMALRFGQKATTFDSPGIDQKYDVQQALKHVIDYRSSPNAVNSVPNFTAYIPTTNIVGIPNGIKKIDPSYRTPNTIELFPNSRFGEQFGNLGSHDIFGYIRYFFDPATGQPYTGAKLQIIQKALDKIFTLKKDLETQGNLLSWAKREGLQKQIEAIASKMSQNSAGITALYAALEKISVPRKNYRKVIPASDNPRDTAQKSTIRMALEIRNRYT